MILLCMWLISISIYGHENIVLFSGFDRDNIPNLSLHVLDTKKNIVKKRIKTDFDSNVGIQQINENLFKASAVNTPDKYVILNEKYEFEEVDVTNEIIPKISPIIRMERNVDININSAFVKILNSDKEISRVYYSEDSSVYFNGYIKNALINNEKSLIYVTEKKIRFIMDIEKPEIIELESSKFPEGFELENAKEIISNSSLNYIFLMIHNLSQNDIYKIEPFNEQKPITKLCSVGKGYIDVLQFFVETNLIVYKANSDSEMVLIDIVTGKTKKIKMKNKYFYKINYFKIKNDYFITIENKLINANNMSEVDVLPEFSEKSIVIVNKDNNLLYYTSYSKNTLFYDTDKIIVYELKQKRIKKEIVIKNLKESEGIHNIFFSKDGKLIILTGSTYIYMDHEHVFDEK